MNDDDDDLLHALAGEARREREREPAWLDERWDRLAAGELPAADEAELRALAAESPAASEALEAFRPLGDDFRQRVVQAIKVQSAAAPELPEQRHAAPPPPDRFRHRSRRRAWLGAGLASAVAVAAALILTVGAHPPLPDYEPVKVTGGEARSRGVPAAPAPPAPTTLALHPGSPLRIEARPATAVLGPVEARWFAAREGEAPRELPAAERQVSKSGAAVLAGTLGKDLDLAPGAWSLWVMVGRPGELPGAAVLGSRGAGAPGWTRRQKDWIAWRVARFQVDPGDGGARPP